MRYLWMLSLVLMACSTAPETPKEEVTDKAAPLSPCDVLGPMQQAGIEGASPEVVAQLPEALTTCLETESGAWGLAVSEFDADPEYPEEWSARLRLIHVDRMGKLVQWDHNLERPSYCYDTRAELSVDEIAERERASIAYAISCPDGEGWSEDHLLDWQDGGFVIPKGLEDAGMMRIADLDGDGLPDAWASAPYSQSMSMCGGLSGFWRLDFPMLRQGQSDGSFALDTELTRAQALEQCPAPPASYIDPDYSEGPPSEWTAQAFICARLWGVPETDLQSVMSQACSNVDLSSNDCEDCEGEADCICEPACIDPICANQEELGKILSIEPVFTLQ